MAKTKKTKQKTTRKFVNGKFFKTFCAQSKVESDGGNPNVLALIIASKSTLNE